MQDLPPKQGFSPIVYKKRNPVRGPPGWLIFLGAGVALGGGLLSIIWTNRDDYTLNLERQWSRIHLTPLLQAEEDRKFLAWKAKTDAEEAELLKDSKDPKINEPIIHSKKRFYAPGHY